MNTDSIIKPQDRIFRVYGRDNVVVDIFGKCLGFSSSQRETHDHPLTTDENGKLVEYSQPGVRCSACRWFEVSIYHVKHEYLFNVDVDPEINIIYDDNCARKVSPTAQFLLATTGNTIVPNETKMRRLVWTNSAYEVIEFLTQRRNNVTPFLPMASARVLAQAATWNDDFRDAYINRAVV